MKFNETLFNPLNDKRTPNLHHDESSDWIPQLREKKIKDNAANNKIIMGLIKNKKMVSFYANIKENLIMGL